MQPQYPNTKRVMSQQFISVGETPHGIIQPGNHLCIEGFNQGFHTVQLTITSTLKKEFETMKGKE
jgi:hypothetical protein